RGAGPGWARRGLAVTWAPPRRASCTAKSPTPPVAPVTSTRLPRIVPFLPSAGSAVSPATGNVAACENVTFSGSSASACVGTATRSAQAPSGRKPTTRAPTLGPDPSAAARSTVPARSQPGRQPAAAMVERRTSPRFREIARTRTMASPRSGVGSGTARMIRRPAAAGSTTTAWLSLIGSSLDDAVLLELGDLVRLDAEQALVDFGVVLAQQRRAADLGRRFGQAHRVAGHRVRAAPRVLEIDDEAALAQVRVGQDLGGVEDPAP